MKHCLLVLVAFVAFPASAQQNVTSDFVIDQSKPYAYLKFDHIGPRKPTQSGESDLGLWLKVVNNCRIPIVFRGSSSLPGNPGVTLMDKVIEVEPVMEIIATSSDEEMETKERERQEKEKARVRHLKQKPIGYSCEVCGVVRVEP